MMTTSYWSAVGTTSSIAFATMLRGRRGKALRPPVLLHSDLPRPVAGLDHQVVIARLVGEDPVLRALAPALAVGVTRGGVEAELGVDDEDGDRVGIAAEQQSG